MYAIVAIVLLVMTAVCAVFLAKSYQAGLTLSALPTGALALILAYVLWKKDKL